jgi:hypothetical protein
LVRDGVNGVWKVWSNKVRRYYASLYTSQEATALHLFPAVMMGFPAVAVVANALMAILWLERYERMVDDRLERIKGNPLLMAWTRGVQVERLGSAVGGVVYISVVFDAAMVLCVHVALFFPAAEELRRRLAPELDARLVTLLSCVAFVAHAAARVILSAAPHLLTSFWMVAAIELTEAYRTHLEKSCGEPSDDAARVTFMDAVLEGDVSTAVRGPRRRRAPGQLAHSDHSDHSDSALAPPSPDRSLHSRAHALAMRSPSMATVRDILVLHDDADHDDGANGANGADGGGSGDNSGHSAHSMSRSHSALAAPSSPSPPSPPSSPSSPSLPSPFSSPGERVPILLPRSTMESGGLRAASQAAAPGAGSRRRSGRAVRVRVEQVESWITGYALLRELVSGLSDSFVKFRVVRVSAEFLSTLAAIAAAGLTPPVARPGLVVYALLSAFSTLFLVARLLRILDVPPRVNDALSRLRATIAHHVSARGRRLEGRLADLADSAQNLSGISVRFPFSIAPWGVLVTGSVMVKAVLTMLSITFIVVQIHAGFRQQEEQRDLNR